MFYYSQKYLYLLLSLIERGIICSINRFIIVTGILICLLNSLNSYAADITSAQTGDWDDGNTWVGGVVPGAADNATIANGHTVTLGSPNTIITNLTIQSGALLNDDNKPGFTVTGDFTLNGEFWCTRDITLSGTNTTIDGTGIKTKAVYQAAVGDIIISGGNKTILSSADLTIARGDIIINTGVTVINNGIIITGTDDEGNINGQDASSTWTQGSDSKLNYCWNDGDLAPMQTGIFNASANGNTVNYTKFGYVEFAMPDDGSYYNLEIKGSDEKRLLENAIIQGNLTITSWLNPDGFDITIGGNWTNSGIFTHGGVTTVTFNGSENQTITNSSGEEFWNLTVNKSGATLIIDDNVEVSPGGGGVLTMTQGNILVNSGNILTLGNSCVENTLNHTSGFIVGPFQRGIANPGTFLFPAGTFGSPDYFRPAYVTINTLTACGSLTGEFVTEDPGTDGLALRDGLPLPDSVRGTFSEGYWVLKPNSNFSCSDYNLEIVGNGFDSYTINSTTRILKRAGSSDPWTVDGSHTTANPDTVYRNTLTGGFSHFCFGDTTNCNPPNTSPISGPDSVCTGDTVNYSVTNTPGSSYDWTVENGDIITLETDQITVVWGNTGGISTVQVIEDNGCTQGSAVTKNVDVHPLPTSSINGIISTDKYSTEIYSVTERTGYSYNWYVSGGLITSGNGTDSITVDWGEEGTGLVQCIAGSTCGSADPVVLSVTIYGSIISVQSGFWDDPSTWNCNCVPSESNSAIVNNNHIVTLPGGFTRRITNFTIRATGELDDDSRDFMVHGNFIINGTFSGGGILYLDGSDTYIGGTGTISKGSDIQIQGGNKTILSSADLSVPNATITLSLVDVTNNGIITINNNILGNAGTENWTNAGNSTLNYGGTDLSSIGAFFASASDNTVNYYSNSVNQTIKCTQNGQYWHLITSGTSIKTLECDINIDGNLSVYGSSQFDVSSYNITIAGNWTDTSYNADAFFERTQTVTFNSSVNQRIICPGGESFYNLTIAKSGGSLILKNDVTVSSTAGGMLTLTSGIIKTGSNTLTLGTGIANESIGDLSYSSGWIAGKFQRWINTTGNFYLFPIGTLSYYRGDSIQFNALTGGLLVSEFVATNPGTAGLYLVEGTDSIYNTFTEGYWQLTATDGLSSGDYDLRLTGNGFSSYTIDPETRILYRANASGDWSLKGNHQAATANTAKRNGITSSLAQYCFGDNTPCTPPANTISGADSVCTNSAGEQYTITDHTPNIYTWLCTGGTINPAPSPDDDTIYVDWGSTGETGKVQMVEKDNCGNGDTVTLNVNIHPLPASSITGKTTGLSQYGSDEPYTVVPCRPGYSYEWSVAQNGGTILSGKVRVLLL